MACETAPTMRYSSFASLASSDESLRSDKRSALLPQRLKKMS